MIAAGETWPGTLEPGRRCGFMTGAPLPPGADAVVRQEDTWQWESSAGLFASTAGRRGQSAGRRSRRRRLLLPVGILISARGRLLAAAGVKEVLVYRRPRVAVLATGRNW